MAIYQQLIDSNLGWLFALVWVSILAGSVWIGFVLRRNSMSRIASAVAGVAFFLLQSLVYERIQRKMLETAQTPEGLKTGIQVLVAVLLGVVPLAIPLMAEITLRVLRPKGK